MKKLIRSFVATVSILLFLYCLDVTKGCGNYPMEEDYRIFLFNPDVSGVKGMEKLYFTTTLYNDQYNDPNSHGADADNNVKEWFLFCKGKATIQDIDSILYSTSPEVFLGIVDKKDKYRKYTADNSFVKYLLEANNKEALNYMVYAKKFEYLNFSNDPWEDYYWGSMDGSALNYLFEEGKLLLGELKSDFIKERYAFQLVRAARYLSMPSECVKLYDSLFEKTTTNSVVKSWAMAHKASCLYYTGDIAKADYLFSRVFELSDEKADRAFMGFEGKKMKESLSYCKNNRERANLYILKSLKNPGRALTEIKNIYQIDPYANKLEVIIGREINKLEDWILTKKYSGFSPASSSYIFQTMNYQSDLTYLSKVRSFVEEVAQSEKVNNPSYWYLAAAHLCLMSDSLVDGRKYLLLADQAKGKTKRIEMQLKYSGVLLFVNHDGGITDSMENRVYQDLSYLQQNRKYMKNFDRQFSNLMLAISDTYKKQKMIYKAGLIKSKVVSAFMHDDNRYDYSSYFYYLDDHASAEDMDTLIAVMRKKDKTPYEKFLYEKVGQDKLRLLDLYGTKYLRKNMLHRAYSIFKQIPDIFYDTTQYSYKTYLDSNPFYVNVDHGHSRSYADTVCYNKREMVREMLALMDKAELDVKNKAYCYYLLGNAYFNMTHHGNSWMMYKYWWSGSEEANDFSFDNQVYYGCERAKKYYLKAYETAKDEKFKVLCLRMAGICQENKNYVSKTLWEKKKVYNKYYRQMEDKYPDFYRQLVLECAPVEEFLPIKLKRIL